MFQILYELQSVSWNTYTSTTVVYIYILFVAYLNLILKRQYLRLIAPGSQSANCLVFMALRRAVAWHLSQRLKGVGAAKG